MKKIFFLILLFLLNILPIEASNHFSEEYNYDLYRAKVIEISETKVVSGEQQQTIQEAKIVILNRDKKGTETIITNTLTNNELYDMPLTEGSIINVHFENDNFYFISYDNLRPIMLLLIVFLISLIVIGGLKGIKSLLALLITLFLITFVMAPLLLKGYSPILISILTCALATIITFLIIVGYNQKSIAATIGTVGGLVIGGLIAYFFGIFARLTGFSSDDATMLLYMPNAIQFDFRGLLFAGIIIGALGAAMDVSISISSSLSELKRNNPLITIKQLIESGFNVGRDVMGTMINTLTLAYVGGTITIILLFVGLQTNLHHIINLDFIATEIVRAIAGSIGLLFAIPFTIFSFIAIGGEPK